MTYLALPIEVALVPKSILRKWSKVLDIEYSEVEAWIEVDDWRWSEKVGSGVGIAAEADEQSNIWEILYPPTQRGRKEGPVWIKNIDTVGNRITFDCSRGLDVKAND